MADFVGAIDQGTTSTRFVLFDRSGRIVAIVQKEHEQIYPKPGWVEHSPEEIWQRTQEVIEQGCELKGIQAKDLAAVGITNQRETTVIWDRKTGKPVCNALVWQDTRTADYLLELSAKGGQDRFRQQTGLPLANYFSGLKIRWILDNVPGARELAETGDALFGNIDSFLIWKLSGGPDGGIHVTDVSNASRTQLMNLESLAWDQQILDVLWNSPGPCCLALLPVAKSMVSVRLVGWKACPSPAIWAISNPHLSDRPVSSQVKLRIRTEQDVSCC